LGAFIFGQLKRWAKYQHGNKNRWWIYHRYFHDNHFTDQRISKKGMENHRLYRIEYVPIRYHVKVPELYTGKLAAYTQNSTFANRTRRHDQCLQKSCFLANTPDKMTKFVK
jgi:RNA-directed DNA polymerase